MIVLACVLAIIVGFTIGFAARVLKQRWLGR